MYLLNIVVCHKPVRSILLSQEQQPTPNSLRLNPYDILPLANIMKLKSMIQCKVICICMGTMESIEALQRCYAMGADEVILLCDAHFAGADTLATSYVLAETINKLGNIDLVVCGKKSMDGETGQVPIGIAQRLKMQYLLHVGEILKLDDDAAIVAVLNSDRKDIVHAELPLVTVFEDFQLEEPSISLFALKRAQNRKCIIWTAEDLDVNMSHLGQKGSKTKVVDIQKAMQVKEAQVIEGTVEEKVAFMLSVFKEGGEL